MFLISVSLKIFYDVVISHYKWIFIPFFAKFCIVFLKYGPWNYICFSPHKTLMSPGCQDIRLGFMNVLGFLREKGRKMHPLMCTKRNYLLWIFYLILNTFECILLSCISFDTITCSLSWDSVSFALLWLSLQWFEICAAQVLVPVFLWEYKLWRLSDLCKFAYLKPN